MKKKITGEFAEEEKGDIQHLRLCTDLEIDLVACIVRFLADRNTAS